MQHLKFFTRQELIFITLFFIAWRTVLFGIGAVADTFLPYSPSFPYADVTLVEFPLPRWVFSWANFDGVHYVRIGQTGYVGTGSVQAFFPLMPYGILHTAHQIFGDSFNVLLFGVIVTNLFAYLLVLAWFGFVKEIHNAKIAWLALLSLFLFPTAVFLGALYTESLFLFLVITAFWMAHKKWWILAGIVTGLVTATRIVGVFLIPALLIEVILQNLKHQQLRYYLKKPQQLVQESLQIVWKNWQSVLCILLSFIGVGVYMLFLNGEFHDPFYFAHVQTSFGSGREETFVLYPQVVWRSIKILLTSRPFDLRYFTYIQEFVAGVIGLVLILWSAKYVRWSYVFFSLAAFLLPTTTGTFSSMPRYLIVCFSIFLLFAKLLEKKPRAMLLCLGLSSVVLIVNTIMFIQGYWVA